MCQIGFPFQEEKTFLLGLILACAAGYAIKELSVEARRCWAEWLAFQDEVDQ